MSKPKLLVVPIVLKCGRWMFHLRCQDCGRLRGYTPSWRVLCRLLQSHSQSCQWNPWKLEKAG